METASWLGSEAIGIATSFLLNIFSSGFLYGLLGLIIGIVVVVMGHRRRWFKRPNKLWNVLLYGHYLLIPGLFWLTGVFFGAASGIEGTVTDWIDNSSQGIKDYTEQFVPTIEEIAKDLQQQTGIISEDDLDDKIRESGKEVVGEGWALGLYTYVARQIIGYTLTSLGLEDDPANVPKLADPENIRKMRDQPLDGVTGYIKQGIGTYMSGWYWGFFLILAPFYLYLLVEYIIYRINGKVAPIARDRINNIRNR